MTSVYALTVRAHGCARASSSRTSCTQARACEFALCLRVRPHAGVRVWAQEAGGPGPPGKCSRASCTSLSRTNAPSGVTMCGDGVSMRTSRRIDVMSASRISAVRTSMKRITTVSPDGRCSASRDVYLIRCAAQESVHRAPIDAPTDDNHKP